MTASGALAFASAPLNLGVAGLTRNRGPANPTGIGGKPGLILANGADSA